MKITKNTSGYSTRELKRIICLVHSYMRKLERRPAPRWKNLSVHVRGRDGGNVSGRAFYNGCGYVNGWDVVLTIPRRVCKGSGFWTEHKGRVNNFRARRFAWLVYHELMHTYGYNHKQYTDIRDCDLAKLIPDDYVIPTAEEKAKPKATPPPKWATRYASVKKRQKKWAAKQKRAENALKKLATQARYYERTYPDLLPQQ